MKIIHTFPVLDKFDSLIYSLTLSRSVDAVEEKKHRAALLAASERFVTKDTIVIVDAMNYIKGFRYQLYCQARAAGTPSLALHCEAREDCCRAWNAARPGADRKYPADQLEDLFLRFEPPNNQTKWDSPLFTIITEGASSDQLTELFTALLPTLTSAPSRPPSTATQSLVPDLAGASSSSKSQILDTQTQQLIEQVLRAQQSGLAVVRFEGSERSIGLHRPVSLAQLSRIRRQFLHLYRMHPTNNDTGRIRDLFIEYLSSNLYL